MAKKRSVLTASSKALDPTLDALFGASSGPVQPPSKSRYTELLEQKPRDAPLPRAVLQEDGDVDVENDEGDDEDLSEISEELDDEEDKEGESSDEESEEDKGEEKEESEEEVDLMAVEVDSKKNRKRKRKDVNEDLEDRYMSQLAKESEQHSAPKRARAESAEAPKEQEGAEIEAEDKVPVHESLASEEAKSSELDKAARTVFLANVPSEVITSKTAKKALLSHLSTILEKTDAPIESIRFRSTAFASGALPKRAAYITKDVMDATTKSTNAYAVYSSTTAARKAAAELNGTEVLGRHIRVDSVAHPSPTDHRRCVFVGNLGFVDDETVLNTNADGETVEKKRTKVPSDIEEGLWRTFSTQGKVENVRVVRDSKTRVGKGFAYVQFYDGNDVESALLLDGKKFPPMLPRLLRVTRAKDPRKTALAAERSRSKVAASTNATKSTKYKYKATPEEQSMAGRTGKLLGRAAAAAQRRGSNKSRNNGDQRAAPTMKTPEQIVFEGNRASSKDGKPKDLKFGKKGKSKRPVNRSSKRAAEWRKKSS